MAEKNTNPIAVWATTLFLAAILLFAGWTKFTGHTAWEPLKKHYADWFLKGVGVVEMASAMLLLVPKTAWIGAVTLAAIMVGELATNLLDNSRFAAVFNGLFLISLSALLYYRFPRKTPPAK